MTKKTHQADFLLSADAAMRQAGDTAATYLSRSRRHVADAYPKIDKLTGMPPLDQGQQEAEIVAAMIQAQALDYLAWVISAKLTITNDVLQRITAVLESQSCAQVRGTVK